MKKKSKMVLVNTFSWLDYTKEDYIDFLKCNEREFDEDKITDDEVLNWAIDESRFESEDFLDNMAYSKVTYPVIVTGSLGLWDGTHPIYAERVESMGFRLSPCTKQWYYETPSILGAIRKCIGNCDDYDVSFEDGVIYVSAHHHDGTNCFEIRKLSKKGLDASTRALDRFEDLFPKDYWFAKIKEEELF